MKATRLWPAVAATAFLLGGCGGGDSYDTPDPASYEPPPADQPPYDGNATCDSITSGGAELDHNAEPGCLSCGVENSQAAADGDLTTFATVNVTSVGPIDSGVSVRAKAQPGIVYSAGSVAGAALKESSGVLDILWSVQVRTYLGAEQQESQSLNGLTVNIVGGGGDSFGGFQTTKPFDAVEIYFVNTKATGTPFELHEICSDISG